MKNLIKNVFAIFFFISSAALSVAQPVITFERDGYIWMYDGKNETKIVEGIQHSVSPDGKIIAYTKNYDNGKRGGDIYDRAITIYDIGKSEETILDFFQNDNNYEPKFSPDGKYLVFNYWNGNDWNIGLADIQNKRFSILSDKSTSAYSPEWSADGKSVLYSDLENLYLVDLNGNLIKKFKVTDISCSESPGVSSSSRFIYSPPENKIYFDLDTEDELDYPFNVISSLFEYDLNSDKCIRLTGKDMMAVSPVLSSDGKIYFSGFYRSELKKINEEESNADYSVFVYDPSTEKVSRIISNAYSPSITK